MEKYNANQTIQNLKTYLAETKCPMYVKSAGSSDGAVWERKEYVANMRLTNLVGHEIDYAIFEVYPGVETSKAHYPLVSEYLQSLIPQIGAFEANYEHGDVFFKVALPIRDYPLSIETFRVLEEQFVKEIRAHSTTLLAFANGYMPDNLGGLLPTPECESPFTQNQEFILNAAASIREHLVVHSNHNIIAEDHDGELPAWRCEIFTGDEHYFLHILLHAEGFATFKMMAGTRGILVQPPYRRMAGAYLDKQSAIRKVGHFWTGTETEGVSASTTISLREGLIRSERIEQIEAILIKSLRDVCHDVRLLANGIVPSSEAMDEKHEEEEPAERLKRLRRMILAGRAMVHDKEEYDDNDEDHDESDESDDMLGYPFGNAGIDFASLLSKARCSEDADVKDNADTE